MKKASKEREPNDFYESPPYILEELLKREKFEGSVWEPCCGRGILSDILKQHGFKTFSSDLIDRGYPDTVIEDFLQSERVFDNLITNPPFKLALEFIEHAKKHINKKIALFLPLTFLESQRRYPMFNSKEFPLECIYVFSKRQSLYKDGIKLKNGGTIAFCWYIFNKEYKGTEPKINWIL